MKKRALAGFFEQELNSCSGLELRFIKRKYAPKTPARELEAVMLANGSRVKYLLRGGLAYAI